MSKKYLIIILGIVLVNFVSAVPEISDVSINPETPTISDDVQICADVVDDSEISIVRINLKREEPLWNWGLVMDYESTDRYCRTLSPSLMRVWEISEDKTISYYISARNELGDTTTTEKDYFTYYEEPIIFCGDGVIEGDEQCDDRDDNGIACDNSTSSCTYCSSECELITLPYSNQNQQTQSSHKIHFTQFCEPNWKCSGWGECVNGLMTRKCYDKNHCDYSYNKPVEKSSCELILKTFVKEDKFNPVFILLGIITSLILIAVLVGFLGKR